MELIRVSNLVAREVLNLIRVGYLPLHLSAALKTRTNVGWPRESGPHASIANFLRQWPHIKGVIGLAAHQVGL